MIKFDLVAKDDYQANMLSQSQDIGYQNFNTLMVLNTLAFVILIYLAVLVFYIFLRAYITITCQKLGGINLKKKLEHGLFFTRLHTIYIEGFMEIAIMSVLTML